MNAKKILAMVLSLLMVMATLSAVFTVSADETPFDPNNQEEIQLYKGGQSSALGGFGKGATVGGKVTVPEGKRLVQVNFPAFATYNSNENYILFQVYQWDTDYATSVKGPVLAQTAKKNHTDNAPMYVVFPYTRNMTGELLWVATYVDGATQMTPWAASEGGVDDVIYFADGGKTSAFMFTISVADALTVEAPSHTATFVADGVEVGKLTFFEGDTELFGLPEVPAKEGFWGDWAEYTLGNADITIEAVYTDASDSVKPEIPDATNVTGFAEEHKSYLRGTGCAATVNRDGSVSFTGSWDVDGDIDAYAQINYLQLMKKYYEGYNGQSDLPNKSHKYKVVALKVKAPAVSLDSTPNMTVVVGRDTEIYGVEVANQIKCDGNEEYWIFDFTKYSDFTSNVINNMQINWAYSVGEESNLGASFVLMGFRFFDTMEEALSVTGGEEATEAPTEEPTQAPTEEPTQAPTDDPIQAPAETTEADAKGGCGSVVGFASVAVLAAVAAAFVCKKD